MRVFVVVVTDILGCRLAGGGVGGGGVWSFAG